ncbi:MAG: M20 family metallopeptidase [Pigmentiphaga sp.]|nr:M20 family metallopeptidase [Pigmentiphaga sp.]
MESLLRAMREQADEFIGLRQEIHQHPELGYQEFRTSDLVAERLESWGYQVTRGLGGTGVVGRLTRGNGEKRLGLRADMDALPIQEQTGLSYESNRPGIMHACGHDGHTAMLLAAARYLALKGRFDGTLNLIFQPAEEGLGGAKKMMDDGLFEQFPCDAVFAMHNLPGHASGTLLFRTGAAMAASENITIELHGVGGHGAQPHKTKDPIMAGAAIVTALQSIVSRNVPPLEPAVISVGAFQAGHTNNVIPQTATLLLSVRSLNQSVHDMLLSRIDDLVRAQAESFGLKAEVRLQGGYPVLVNTPAETALAHQVGEELVGSENIVAEAAPITASEDFAFMLQQVPGSYLFIGNGSGTAGDHTACAVHNPGYDFNDANIPLGSAYWVRLTERFLVLEESQDCT